MTEVKKKRRASGAGVKANDGALPLVRKQVLLDKVAIDLFNKIGLGNLSLGAREAARRLIASGNTDPFDHEQHNKPADA